MDVRRRQLAAAIVAYEVLKQSKKCQKQRKCWVRSWIERRSGLGASSTLTKELQLEDPQQFRNFVGMSAVQVQFIIELIGPIVAKKDTKFRNAIAVYDRIMLTLRFLVSGDSYGSLQYLFRIPVCTIGRIVKEVTAAIYHVLKERYLKFPNSTEDWLRHAEAFEQRWNFPHCLGALDGKHIVIQAPDNSGSHYYNYKGTHSIVLLAVVDARYKFTYIDVGCNGRVSDGGVFLNCSLYDGLERGTISLPEPVPLPGRNMPVPYCFVADDAFAMKSYILKPYPFRDQPAPNRIFNYRLSRARRIVENAFGIIANKFRVLRRPINLHPDRVRDIVLAICAIHNFLLTPNDSRREYLCPGLVDVEDAENHTLITGSWREETITERAFFQLQRGTRHNYTTSQKDIRDEFKEYFMTPASEVRWQYRHIM